MKKRRVGICALICLALCSSGLIAAKHTDKELKAAQKSREIEEKAYRKAEEARVKAEKKIAEARMQADKKAEEARGKAAKKAAEARMQADKKVEETREKNRKKAESARKKAAEEARKQAEADREAREKDRIRAEKERENARIKAEKDAKAAEKKRQRQARREEEERSGKWDYLYKLPAWPFHAEYSNKKDLLNFYGQYQSATKGYSSSDHSQDLSKLIFGEKAIRVQDILLASKLVKDGKVDPGTGAVVADNYLYYLADDTISFAADFEEWRGSFGYSRTFHKNVTFGFDIPVAHREHELKLRTHVSDASNTKIESGAGGGKFPTKYNGSFEAFIRDILAEKNINLIGKNTVSGLGDISTFVYVDIPTKHVEKLLTGVKVRFATARDRDTHKLWDAELGNGGFTEISGFTGLVYAKKRYFNPHLLFQGTYSLSAYVDRRVPRRRTYNGTDAVQQPLGSIDISGLDGIAMDESIKFKLNTPFDEIDTTFRRFATQTKRIKIHRGPEVQLRIGNIFEHFVLRRGFFDIFYDLRAKGRDYVGARLDSDKWNASVLVHNSYEVAHRVGFNSAYQFDEHFRFELGGLYTLAGRNVAEVWEANGTIKWEF